jgi:hypothetical protein
MKAERERERETETERGNAYANNCESTLFHQAMLSSNTYISMVPNVSRERKREKKRERKKKKIGIL